VVTSVLQRNETQRNANEETRMSVVVVLIDMHTEENSCTDVKIEVKW
jgi:hypothetical protein